MPWWTGLMLWEDVSFQSNKCLHRFSCLHSHPLNICFSSVQLLSCVQLFANPWTAACQASLSITNSQSLLKLMSIELVMPSNHFILCRPLLLPPSVFPSIRVFSNESVLRIRWPKYWSINFSISPSNEYSGFISMHNGVCMFIPSSWFIPPPPRFLFGNYKCVFYIFKSLSVL